MRENGIEDGGRSWFGGLWHALQAGACALLAVLSMQAHAQQDPPSLAGRVAAVSGPAWYFDAERNIWSQLVRNQTVAQGDRLRVDPKSRVSLRIGSTSVWLDGNSDMEISQMDDAGISLRLEKGALGLGLRARDQVDEYRVQTREGALFPDDMGVYRIEQLPHGTRAQALQGRLRFESDRSGGMQRAWLRDAEQAEFWWADGPRIDHQALLKDGFANWLLAQAVNEGAMASQDYVSPEMTGAEELDRHGVWQQSPEYGAVWTPTQVAPGWEPYSDGRWQWTAYWGWSWVDNASWGFAPFHYGRWVVWRGRWCWTPGHYVARPVYAPAMVTWVGPPRPVVVGVAVRQPPLRGSWAPLPPREVYRPPFRHSEDYITRLNRQYDGQPWQSPGGQQRQEGRPRDNPPQSYPRETLPWKGDLGPRRPPDAVGPPRTSHPVVQPQQPAPPPPAPVIVNNNPPPRPQPGANPEPQRPWRDTERGGWGRGEPQDQGPQPRPARPRENLPPPSDMVPAPQQRPQMQPPQERPQPVPQQQQRPQVQPTPQPAVVPQQRPQQQAPQPQPQEGEQKGKRKNDDPRWVHLER